MKLVAIFLLAISTFTCVAQNDAWLIEAKGIDPNRVSFKGYGKRKPIATNDTPEGRKQNQRVEIKILQIR